MKSLLVKLGILLLLLLAVGCSSINKQMESTMGQPISTIIASWGPPLRVTPDDRGGNIYTWEEWVPTKFGYGYPVRSKMLWVDSTGTVYQWRLEGLRPH